MKSTVINALALFFLCINGAITSSLIDTLTIDDVSLFYQASNLIFLPLILGVKSCVHTRGSHHDVEKGSDAFGENGPPEVERPDLGLHRHQRVHSRLRREGVDFTIILKCQNI